MPISDKNHALPLRKIATRQLLRDWRAGSLTVLLCSLILAVATVTSIGLFTSRIHHSIFAEAANFLAADARINGSMEIPQEWQLKAIEKEIEIARYIEFSSMVFSDERMILSQVKAVDGAYPLKGELLADSKPYTQGIVQQQGPLPGDIWLAPRLFDALNVKVGDKVSVGDADFTVSKSIAREPDNGQSLFGVSPRTMINIVDVPRTQAVQVGSRINYALLLSGPESAIESFHQWLEPKQGHHFRWQLAHTSNRSVGDALQRATRFLLLAGSLSVILGGVAVALAARRYAKKHIKTVALLKTLGATPSDIIKLFGILLVILGAAGVAFGAVTGWLFHLIILQLIASLLTSELAAADWSAYGIGAATGFIALLAFACPPILALYKVLPAQALTNRNLKKDSNLLQNSAGFIAILLIVFLYSGSVSLTLYLVLGTLICVTGVFALSWLVIRLSKFLAPKVNHTWRLGLQNLQRHQQTNAMQMMIFAILFLLIATLYGVRTHLIGQWQNQVPEMAANHFAFNIFPEELDAIQQQFQTANIDHSPFYPMTRGRLIAVNGTPAQEILKENTDNRMDYEREVNLTSSATLGEDNKITQGKWWNELPTTESTRISVEADYAKGLNIEINDKVTFSLAGQELTATVASIRSVQWDSMNPNFFVIFEQPLAQKYGANWLTSFYLPPNEKSFISSISRQYPTISIIEFDQTLDQVRSIIQKISAAVEFILVLVLVSGLLVLVTSIQATLDTRLKESAILRTIGASQSLVRKTLFVEFAALGLLAGILAVIGTEAIMLFLQTGIFELTYSPFYAIWIWLPLSGTILLALTGWFSTRSVVTTPPVEVLRKLG